jgi:hypothetical protein
MRMFTDDLHQHDFRVPVPLECQEHFRSPGAHCAQDDHHRSVQLSSRNDESVELTSCTAETDNIQVSFVPYSSDCPGTYTIELRASAASRILGSSSDKITVDERFVEGTAFDFKCVRRDGASAKRNNQGSCSSANLHHREAQLRRRNCERTQTGSHQSFVHLSSCLGQDVLSDYADDDGNDLASRARKRSRG